MRKETEEEFKYLVSYEWYQMMLSKCSARYPSYNDCLQVNYYYDTEDYVLNKMNTTVRIRQKDDVSELQIKKHHKYDRELVTSDEYTKEIDVLPYMIKATSIPCILRLKGVLITERRTFTFGNNSIICFDKNVYLGICDYEVEIEVDKSDIDEALEIVAYLNVEQKQIESKSERFFKRLNAICDEVSNISLL